SYRYAGGSLSAPRPIRHYSFPYRLSSLPALASGFVSASDHLARPARPARSAAGLQPIYRYARCLHFAFATGPTAASSLGGHGLPWAPRRFFRLPGETGGLSAF